MSNVDPTVPVATNPTTASVRNNFAIIKSELEALQAFAIATEVNLANFLTSTQYSAWQAGTTNFDLSVPLQAALNFAAGLVSASGGQLAATVKIPAGLGQLQTAAVSVPAKVTIDCEGIIQNALASSTTPCVTFASGSHCKRLVIDANGKNGVTFGAAGVDASMTIGFCYVYNVDTGAGVGARLFGNRIAFDRIRVQGGLVGVDFGDNGSTATPNRIFGNQLQVSLAGTGVRIVKANVASVGRITTDSCSVSGLKIDLSHEVMLHSVECFWDDANGGSKYTSNPINIGASSGADNVSGLTLFARVFNTGSAYAAVLANVKTSSIVIDCATTGNLSTGVANPISTAAVNFGASVDATNFVLVHCNSGLTGHAGTPAGAYIERISANDAIYQPQSLIGGVSVGPTTEATAIKALANAFVSNDISFTTQTTPQTVGLSIAIAANETWVCEFVLDLGAALATTGFIAQVNCPAGGTLNAALGVIPDVSGAATATGKRTSTSGANLTFASASLTSVGTAVLRASVHVANGATPGTIELKISQATSSATALTVKAGSKVSATRLV